MCVCVLGGCCLPDTQVGDIACWVGAACLEVIGLDGCKVLHGVIRSDRVTCSHKFGLMVLVLIFSALWKCEGVQLIKGLLSCALSNQDDLPTDPCQVVFLGGGPNALLPKRE